MGSFQFPLGALADLNNSVTDTIVTHAAAEYSGAAGIQVCSACNGLWRGGHSGGLLEYR